jgi:hypothetical protein
LNKRILVLVLGLLASLPVSINLAYATERPVIASFKMTPNSVEATTGISKVDFDLTASNPTGIYSNQVQITLTDGNSNSLATVIPRTDNPINPALSTVNFHGSLVIPSNFPSGVYFAYAKQVISANADGSAGFSTDNFQATTDTKLVGATNGLMIRSSGLLNFNFKTFNGPAFDRTRGAVFVDPKYNTVSNPIWRVGESVDISNYYELLVPTLALKLIANTPSICTSSGTKLLLVAVGACSFTVSTDPTSDYLSQRSDSTISVSVARVKPTYSIGQIPTQSSINLPLNIQGPIVSSPFGLISPTTSTPNVCYVVGIYVKVISGGTCKLSYSTPESTDYLASDVYELIFDITRAPQTLIFTLPAILDGSQSEIKLDAKSSAGLTPMYATGTPSVCEVSDNYLRVKSSGLCKVTASQNGTTTISPASASATVEIALLTQSVKPKNKVSCLKNGRVRIYQRDKCPGGYKKISKN